MRSKQAKKLRKLAGYTKPEKAQYAITTHGKREKIIGNRYISKYIAYTAVNATKANYKRAKASFFALKKTFNA